MCICHCIAAQLFVHMNVCFGNFVFVVSRTVCIETENRKSQAAQTVHFSISKNNFSNAFSKYIINFCRVYANFLKRMCAALLRFSFFTHRATLIRASNSKLIIWFRQENSIHFPSTIHCLRDTQALAQTIFAF